MQRESATVPLSSSSSALYLSFYLLHLSFCPSSVQFSVFILPFLFLFVVYNSRAVEVPGTTSTHNVQAEQRPQTLTAPTSPSPNQPTQFNLGPNCKQAQHHHPTHQAELGRIWRGDPDRFASFPLIPPSKNLDFLTHPAPYHGNRGSTCRRPARRTGGP